MGNTINPASGLRKFTQPIVLASPIDITNGIPFDGAPFRIAKYVTGLEILIDAFAYPNLVTG